MIHFQNVSKSYRMRSGGRRRVFTDLTLTLPHRNIAVLGRNGAGKSTLMQLISGMIDPERGWVYRKTRISWPIGFRASFHAQLTGIENIRFVARVYGADEHAVIASAAEFADLGPFLYEPVRTYSSGMSARLAFGLSLALRFDTYLVDELLSVGDTHFKAKSRTAFTELVSRSRLIMASHSIQSLREYCDCGVVVREGSAIFYNTLEEALDEYQKKHV